MQQFLQLLQNRYTSSAPILDPSISMNWYIPISLAVDNPALKDLDLSDPDQCEHYINKQLSSQNARIAYGGYLEPRALYTRSELFQFPESDRNIHLGVDFWGPEGTSVHAPIEGSIHSFADNQGIGNYGPTLILEHRLGDDPFFTLYGHLSRSSIEEWEVGRTLSTGEQLGNLGSMHENGNYAPHLHFQLILDIGEHKGDYPGVCSQETLETFANNCPNPGILLQIPH